VFDDMHVPHYRSHVLRVWRSHSFECISLHSFTRWRLRYAYLALRPVLGAALE
jgi:hypothetical protein